MSMGMSFFIMPSQRRVGRPLQTSAIRQAYGPEQSRRTYGQSSSKTMTSCSCTWFEAARWAPY